MGITACGHVLWSKQPVEKEQGSIASGIRRFYSVLSGMGRRVRNACQTGATARIRRPPPPSPAAGAGDGSLERARST
ncbi:protein of unknown function [Candidatus Hydrogenisulfobacillus filiaventi]|uniref:Uncharacterized protein n=1 Tax=Candidatus Hydrogenisulfobacillus filiaventi TaxID=2707344 RepID=A0A6F8ZDZ1_9FIRM|nr:protein of unknown function [Candidatus Hydrogenisulfobacillus filiaventi]